MVAHSANLGLVLSLPKDRTRLIAGLGLPFCKNYIITPSSALKHSGACRRMPDTASRILMFCLESAAVM